MKNAKLLNTFKLSGKVTIFVPATVNISEKVDNSAQVDAALSLLSVCFGGATETDAVGAWMSPTAGLVKERTTMVFAYCTTEQLDGSIERLIEFCEQLRDEMKQDAVALEVNGEMYFV